MQNAAPPRRSSRRPRRTRARSRWLLGSLRSAPGAAGTRPRRTLERAADADRSARAACSSRTRRKAPSPRNIESPSRNHHGVEDLRAKPISEQHELENGEHDERPEREARASEPRFRLFGERVVGKLALECFSFLADGAVERLAQRAPLFLHRLGFLELASRREDRERHRGRLHRAGQEREYGPEPAEPRPGEHDELGVAEAHAGSSPHALIEENERQPDEHETSDGAEQGFEKARAL